MFRCQEKAQAVAAEDGCIGKPLWSVSNLFELLIAGACSGCGASCRPNKKRLRATGTPKILRTKKELRAQLEGLVRDGRSRKAWGIANRLEVLSCLLQRDFSGAVKQYFRLK